MSDQPNRLSLEAWSVTEPQVGALNPSWSADGQVVAFESEAALVPQDSEFRVGMRR